MYYHFINVYYEKDYSNHLNCEIIVNENLLKNLIFSSERPENIIGIYAFVIRDKELLYLGKSKSSEIQLVNLEDFFKENNNLLNGFRIEPIKKCFYELEKKIVPDKESLSQILGELDAIDITEKLFSSNIELNLNIEFIKNKESV
jgi:hypothetical protein